MTKILVTGGAGFIGAHLAKNLRKNNKIMIVDNFENKGGIPYVNKSDIFVKAVYNGNFLKWINQEMTTKGSFFLLLLFTH